MSKSARLMSTTVFIAALAAASAVAQQPIGSETFNVVSPVDLMTLTPETFEDTLGTFADGTEIIFYDFTESFGPLFVENLIPAFNVLYPGITVTHLSIDGAAGVQQLIAAHEAGREAPADVFFVPNGQVRVANEAGVIANLPLHRMLPAAPDLAEEPATVARGYFHGGVVVPFHRNQTAIGFDTRSLAPEEVPASFDAILEWAKANPGKFAMTSAAGGGSGGGFLESAILGLASEECVAQAQDFSLTSEQAVEWAAGDCLDPVMAYFSELEDYVEITNGNTDTLNLIANGVASMGTVWEDQTFDFIGRGLLPPTVRTTLLETGQVGDGDGLMITSGTNNVAAALLFVNFLLSDEAQVIKVGLNGSRSARTTLDLSAAIDTEMADRLIPTALYNERSRARIAGVVSSAATDRFVVEILQQ